MKNFKMPPFQRTERLNNDAEEATDAEEAQAQINDSQQRVWTFFDKRCLPMSRVSFTLRDKKSNKELKESHNSVQ